MLTYLHTLLVWYAVIGTAVDDGAGVVFGSIVGGADVDQRKRSAVGTAARDVAGFVLDGFATGEPAATTLELVTSVIRELPAAKPKVLPGVFGPEQVLQYISLGIDLFDGYD